MQLVLRQELDPVLYFCLELALGLTPVTHFPEACIADDSSIRGFFNMATLH